MKFVDLFILIFSLSILGIIVKIKFLSGKFACKNCNRKKCKINAKTVEK